jgi:glycosyltransferase involved in cell wall biosynthesis
MPALRVCFFNRSYWPDHGATGQLLTELAEDLVREYACKVSVVVGPPLSTGKTADARARSWIPVRRELRNRVEIFRAASTVFKPQRFTGRAANYLSYFLSACLAGLWVPRPDVVVSLTDPPIIGLAALLSARRSGARFVFLCQDVFPEVAWLLEDFHSAQLNRLLDRINRLLIQKADQVITLGETMRERLIEGKGADPQKVKVIHNWADCSAITPGSKRNPFSISHGLAEAFVVMHSGNMGLSQNLGTLLDAADRLRSYPDLVLAMVGDGAKRQALEARARSQRLTNIHFFRYQPKESLRDSFASADVFVVSLKRGLAGYIVPSKLYGILAAGRPYVAAVEEACEVATITRQYDCGLLVEPGDAKALADKILSLYYDRALAQRLGANARRAALAFDRPLQVRAYYNLFRDVLRGSQTLS